MNSSDLPLGFCTHSTHSNSNPKWNINRLKHPNTSINTDRDKPHSITQSTLHKNTRASNEEAQALNSLCVPHAFSVYMMIRSAFPLNLLPNHSKPNIIRSHLISHFYTARHSTARRTARQFQTQSVRLEPGTLPRQNRFCFTVELLRLFKYTV